MRRKKSGKHDKSPLELGKFRKSNIRNINIFSEKLTYETWRDLNVNSTLRDRPLFVSKSIQDSGFHLYFVARLLLYD